jgi:hypothetical protein
MSRAALEYIGQGGLGYAFETFDENTPNEYSMAVKGLLYVCSSIHLIRRSEDIMTQ